MAVPQYSSAFASSRPFRNFDIIFMTAPCSDEEREFGENVARLHIDARRYRPTSAPFFEFEPKSEAQSR